MESFQHNQVKLAVAVALREKGRRERLGVYFTDGMSLQLPDGKGLYTPDGFFVTWKQFKASCRIRFGVRNTMVILVGVPSIVVEVASPTRLDADTKTKLREYEWAGVREYWLFRPSGSGYAFDLLTLGGWRGARKLVRDGKLEGEWPPATAADQPRRLASVLARCSPLRPRYYVQQPRGEGGYSRVLRQYARLHTLATSIRELPHYELRLSDGGGGTPVRAPRRLRWERKTPSLLSRKPEGANDVSPRREP